MGERHTDEPRALIPGSEQREAEQSARAAHGRAMRANTSLIHYSNYYMHVTITGG